MPKKEAELIKTRIAELESEMMAFRITMARVLASLYETVHALESQQRWQDTTQITTLRRLRDCIVEYFSLEELKTMCFDLGVNDDMFGGAGINNLARELVKYMHRENRLDALIDYCREKRPNVPI
jgi:hypothetical protein